MFVLLDFSVLSSAVASTSLVSTEEWRPIVDGSAPPDWKVNICFHSATQNKQSLYLFPCLMAKPLAPPLVQGLAGVPCFCVRLVSGRPQMAHYFSTPPPARVEGNVLKLLVNGYFPAFFGYLEESEKKWCRSEKISARKKREMKGKWTLSAKKHRWF